MTTKALRVTSGLVAACVLGACATASKDVKTSYVSPIQYQGYNCEQLTLEAQRIQGRVSQLGGRLDEAASNDKTLTGVGLILFWPALFALGGTKEQEAEYSRLKGEYEAVQQAAIGKNCMSQTAGGQGNAVQNDPKKTREAVEAELVHLKKMYDDGLISKEVYEDRQKQLLNK